MIRIRYKDLAPGLHGKAERCGRRTTIFLVPGLTSAQRKAALRRLRQEARRRCGPQLPLSQLVIALAADRVRVTFRGTTAVIRLHPAGSILSTATVGSLMVLFVLASVSAQIIHQPGTPGTGGAPMVGAGGGSPSPGPVPRVTGPDPADPGGAGGSSGGGGSGGAGASGKLPRPLVVSSSSSGADGAGSGSGASVGPVSGSGSGGGSGQVSLGVSADAGRAGVSLAVSAGPSRPRPLGGSSRGGGISVCVNIGSFGGCTRL